ncbi:MAG: GNAT family N-acetyltransferase [Methylobacillus sp.]|nr:GNAT family N-acetyltransferase [Methylobacillus sp.]
MLLEIHTLTRPMQNSSSPLYCSLARDPAEILEAQALRYKVFVEEMGAQLSDAEQLDRDGYDPFCDHLLVRDRETDRIVGAYRILSPDMAREAGGYYSAQEFDLSRLEPLFDRMVEVGRACVHPDYRNGSTISLLWTGLARYMLQNRYEYLIGCASIGMADGGHLAASIYKKVKAEYLSPPEYRVFPRAPLPLDKLRSDLDAPLPALLKGYLRVGAYICGEPTWDPVFNTADLLVMQPVSRMSRRYADHFYRS